MIATRPISRGSLVLEEKPLLLVDSTMDESALAAAVAALSESSRTAFMSLHNAHSADSEPYSGIVKSNALPHVGGTEVSSGGIT